MMVNTGTGGNWVSRGQQGDIDEDGTRLYDQRVILRLLSYVGPYKFPVFLAMMAVVVYTGATVAIPLIIAIGIDRYIENGDLSGLNTLAVWFGVVLVVHYAANYAHQVLLARVSQRVIYDLRNDLFKHLQDLPMSFHNRHKVGSVMSRAQNDVYQLQEFLDIVVLSIGDLLSLSGIIGIHAGQGLAVVPALVRQPARADGHHLGVAEARTPGVPARPRRHLAGERVARGEPGRRARRAEHEPPADEHGGVRRTERLPPADEPARPAARLLAHAGGGDVHVVQPRGDHHLRRQARARRNAGRRPTRAVHALHPTLLRPDPQPDDAVHAAAARDGVRRAHLRPAGHRAGPGRRAGCLSRCRRYRARYGTRTCRSSTSRARKCSPG